MNEKEYLKLLKAYPLSNEDLDSLMYNGATNIVQYRTLDPDRSILDYLDSEGRMILLLPVQSDQSGHWVCLWLDGDTLSYFDPFGLPPDRFLSWKEVKRKPRPILTEMLNNLHDEGFKVLFNPNRYQKDSTTVNSCGRWCALRLMCKDLSEKQFKRLISKEGIDNDTVVTYITHNLMTNKK